MTDPSRRDFLITVPAVLAATSSATAAPDSNDLKLWYDKPAASWNKAHP